jgi:malate:Na+ symporter
MVPEKQLKMEHQLLELPLHPKPLWKKILDFKIGIIPVSVYLPFFLLTYLLMLDGKLPKDMLGAIPVMVLFGFCLAEIGNRIPILKNLGGAPIIATFVPSYMVAHHLLPTLAIDTVSSFMKSTNFLYVYIAMIVVGSILGMNRKVLIKAFVKMFIPLLVGTVMAVGLGLATGCLLGIGAFKTFFYIIVPIMAGGVGEGAVPLSIGYAQILHVTQEQTFAQVLPAVMLGSLSAIILSGLLKRLGEKKPEYSGNGSLIKSGDEEILKLSVQEKKPIDLAQMAVGGCTAIGLYLFGVYVNKLTGLPGPIVMLFTAVTLKALGWLPKEIEDGAHMIYRFFVVGVTYPLLLAVGVAMTPWDSLISVLSPAYLITIFVTVLSMVASGFFVGRLLNMYPIEAAIVTACHSGQGGTGDVAILTAANRLVLMPFAQVSTRIGGACMVTLAIFLLKWFMN